MYRTQGGKDKHTLTQIQNIHKIKKYIYKLDLKYFTLSKFHLRG